jgi:hypothetical protein
MRAGKAGPMTPAERQRAYRERQGKNKSVAIPRAAAPPEDQDEEAEVSIAEINARMRRMALRAFDEVGGVQFLRRVAAKNPNTFLRFVGQFVTKDDAVNPAAFQFVIQKLTIEGGAPVRGVIASPVASDIHPEQRWLAPPATEVIDG